MRIERHEHESRETGLEAHLMFGGHGVVAGVGQSRDGIEIS